MGFRASRKTEATPTILIIAGLELDMTGSPVKSISGADAMLLHAANAKLTAITLQKMVKPLKDIPWGIYMEEGGNAPTAPVKAGCDFGEC